MPAFKQWDIIKVPFPYTDRPVRQRRPAVIIAAGEALSEHGLLWVMMITSAVNRGWAGDIEIADHQAAGLPVPSVVRTAKIATIDAKDAEAIGGLPAKLRKAISKSVEAQLDF
jgi:mRNA interferase MazF